MKVLIFLDEHYYKSEEGYVSQYNAGRFLLGMRPEVEPIFILPVQSGSPPPELSKGMAGTFLPLDIPVIPLPGWTSLAGYLRNLVKNRSAVANEVSRIIREVDAVWVRLPSLPGLIVADLALRNGKRIVLDFGGDITQAFRGAAYSGLRRFPARIIGSYFRAMEQRVVRKAGDLVTVFHRGGDLAKAFPMGSFFSPCDLLPKTKNPRIHKQGATNFLFVGRLTKDKGISFLLDAWQSVPEDLFLNIAGIGDLESLVRKQAQLHNNIRFCGFVTGIELDRLYENADCVIVPSLASEGFPRVISEAWCHGVPVIATDIGGTGQIGTHGRNLLLVKPGRIEELTSQINALATTTAHYKRLANGAMEAAHLVSGEKMRSSAIRALTRRAWVD